MSEKLCPSSKQNKAEPWGPKPVIVVNEGVMLINLKLTSKSLAEKKLETRRNVINLIHENYQKKGENYELAVIYFPFPPILMDIRGVLSLAQPYPTRRTIAFLDLTVYNYTHIVPQITRVTAAAAYYWWFQSGNKPQHAAEMSLHNMHSPPPLLMPNHYQPTLSHSQSIPLLSPILSLRDIVKLQYANT
ncbi:hypothetical protein J6590_082514 [Homalodisca vitripennis]|nr:hypothetical protein J6590_082514 [Homalodisca vitripennis]